MSVKINKLEIENVKRVKAVKVEPLENGLTIIGGNNGQGKTSVLDSISWALGGDRFRPSQPQYKDSVTPPYLHVVLNNGIVVERKGKNSDLKVLDPDGGKSGQQLLNSFIEELALNLPKFMDASSSEKARILLNIIGIGDQVAALEQEEKDLYNRRLTIGQIADQKKKFADEQTYFPDAPREIISAADMIRRQQEILAKNGENQRKRDNLQNLEQQYRRLSEQISELLARQKSLEEDMAIAKMSAQDLQDESTQELQRSIENIEEINRRVRINLDKDKAEEDALEYKNQYDSLTTKLSGVREKKTALLNNADLPLEDLSVQDGELIYKGQKWDNMSGAEKLIVSTAIVRKLNPECGFVLLDKLEQLDIKTLKEFGQWLEKENLQAIATRVSTGEECSIIIEDGYAAAGSEQVAVVNDDAPSGWKKGEF